MKLLIAGGCSFSECFSQHIDTWPRHLARSLKDYNLRSTAFPSQGNGLISRRIIYQVTESLKTYSPDDILVGIMWSGPGRHDFYLQNVSLPGGDIENPTTFILDSNRNWVITNPGWEIALSQNYYRYYHDDVGQYIYTNEHILRTQWFLKLHNIKYFITTYTSDVLRENNHVDVKHLYDQIDFDHFLPVDGEYEWCRDYSGLPFPTPGDNHPGTEQHKLFTEQVIIPFLTQRKYV